MNETTGVLKWQSNQTISSYASPVVSRDGQTIFIGSTDYKVYALKASSGQIRWAFKTGGAVGNRAVLSSDGAIVVVFSFDRKLYALDAVTGMKRWVFAVGSGFAVDPVLNVQNTSVLLLGSGDGNLYALNVADGFVTWKCAIGGSVDSQIVQDHGMLYFKILTPMGNKLVGVQAADGTLMWTSQPVTHIPLGSPKPPPVLTPGGGLLIGSDVGDGSVRCVSAANGTLLWRVHTGGAVLAPPALDSTRTTAYFGSWDNSVYAVDTQTGQGRWQAFGIPGDSFGNAAVIDGDTVVIPGNSPNFSIYAFDSVSGKEKWRSETSWDASVQLHPAYPRTVFVSLYKLSTLAVDIATGKQLWEGPPSTCLP